MIGGAYALCGAFDRCLCSFAAVPGVLQSEFAGAGAFSHGLGMVTKVVSPSSKEWKDHPDMIGAVEAERQNILRHNVWDFSAAEEASSVRRRDPTAVFGWAHLVGGVKHWELPSKRKSSTAGT